MSNFSSFPQYFQYISNFKSQITYLYTKCGCYVEVQISQSISESPLDFKITRVDCISVWCQGFLQRLTRNVFVKHCAPNYRLVHTKCKVVKGHNSDKIIHFFFFFFFKSGGLLLSPNKLTKIQGPSSNRKA